MIFLMEYKLAKGISIKKFQILFFGFYIAHCKENLHVTPFNHYISKTARPSISSPLVKKSYLGDKLLNPEYQVIASESVNTPPGLSVSLLYPGQPPAPCLQPPGRSRGQLPAPCLQPPGFCRGQPWHPGKAVIQGPGRNPLVPGASVEQGCRGQPRH